MNEPFSRELVRRIAPRLKAELAVQPVVPLEIKLQLERLRLAELRAARAQGDARPACAEPAASTRQHEN